MAVGGSCTNEKEEEEGNDDGFKGKDQPIPKETPIDPSHALHLESQDSSRSPDVEMKQKSKISHRITRLFATARVKSKDLKSCEYNVVPVFKDDNTQFIINSKYIAKGSYAKVFLGVDLSTGCICAAKRIKNIPDHTFSLSEPTSFLRVLREADALRIVHSVETNDTIVKFIEKATFGRSSYIFMEFVHGEPLSKLINRHSQGGIKNKAFLILLFQEILEAVAHCHRYGVAHCDIKPDNFLIVGPNGLSLKLVDFGQAHINITRAADAGVPSDLLRSIADHEKVLMGNGAIAYLPPELLGGISESVFKVGSMHSVADCLNNRGAMAKVDEADAEREECVGEGEDMSSSTFSSSSSSIKSGQSPNFFAADCWSIGLIFYSLIVGHFPFEGIDIYEIIQQIQNDEIVLPPTHFTTPEERELVLGLLDKNPETRLTIEEALALPFFSSLRLKRFLEPDSMLKFRRLTGLHGCKSLYIHRGIHDRFASNLRAAADKMVSKSLTRLKPRRDAREMSRRPSMIIHASHLIHQLERHSSCTDILHDHVPDVCSNDVVDVIRQEELPCYPETRSETDLPSQEKSTTITIEIKAQESKDDSDRSTSLIFLQSDPSSATENKCSIMIPADNAISEIADRLEDTEHEKHSSYNDVFLRDDGESSSSSIHTCISNTTIMETSSPPLTPSQSPHIHGGQYFTPIIKQHQSKPSLDLHEKGLNSLFSTPVVSNADFFVTDDDSSSSSFFEELKQRPEPTTRSPSHSHHSLDYDSQSPPKNPTGGKHLEYQGSKEESEFVV
ncbi:hypothetical protein ADUPG1_006039, partial [Aduncisulcus paluster]